MRWVPSPGLSPWRTGYLGGGGGETGPRVSRLGQTWKRTDVQRSGRGAGIFARGHRGILNKCRVSTAGRAPAWSGPASLFLAGHMGPEVQGSPEGIRLGLGCPSARSSVHQPSRASVICLRRTAVGDQHASLCPLTSRGNVSLLTPLPRIHVTQAFATPAPALLSVPLSAARPPFRWLPWSSGSEPVTGSSGPLPSDHVCSRLLQPVRVHACVCSPPGW